MFDRERVASRVRSSIQNPYTMEKDANPGGAIGRAIKKTKTTASKIFNRAKKTSSKLEEVEAAAAAAKKSSDAALKEKIHKKFVYSNKGAQGPHDGFSAINNIRNKKTSPVNIGTGSVKKNQVNIKSSAPPKVQKSSVANPGKPAKKVEPPPSNPGTPGQQAASEKAQTPGAGTQVKEPETTVGNSTTPAGTPNTPDEKRGMRLRTKLMIGGGLITAGAVGAGTVASAKQKAQQPMAPPTQYPQGY